jgi:hypothetical protein
MSRSGFDENLPQSCQLGISNLEGIKETNQRHFNAAGDRRGWKCGSENRT